MSMTMDVLAYDPNKVRPGWIAFFVVMILVVGTFLLWRSMNRQLGKIRVPPRAAFEPDAADRSSTPAEDDQPAPPTSSPMPPPSSPTPSPPPPPPSSTPRSPSRDEEQP
jgi:hypothetical protein